MQSRKNNPGHANNNNMNNGNNMGNMNNNGPNHMRPPFAGNPMMSGHNSSGGHNMRPPLINRPQRPGPNGPPLLSSQPPNGPPRMPGMGQAGPYNHGNHGNNQGGMQNSLWNQNMGPQQNNRSCIRGNGHPPMHGSPQGGHPPRPNLGPPMGMPRMPPMQVSFEFSSTFDFSKL